MGLTRKLTQSFDNFDSKALQLLDDYLADHGFMRSEGDKGVVKGNAMLFGFEIDSKANQLHLEYRQLPPELTTPHVAKFIRTMIKKGAQPDVSGDRASVYNYFRIYIHNKTLLSIRPKSAIPNRGSIDALLSEVVPDNKEVKDDIYNVDAYAQVYECQAAGSSAFGVEGSIVMEIGNDAAQLNISYQLRGSDWWKWEVTVTGRERDRFKYSSIDYWKHLNGDPNPLGADEPSFHTAGYTYGTALLTLAET